MLVCNSPGSALQNGARLGASAAADVTDEADDAVSLAWRCQHKELQRLVLELAKAEEAQGGASTVATSRAELLARIMAEGSGE